MFERLLELEIPLRRLAYVVTDDDDDDDVGDDDDDGEDDIVYAPIWTYNINQKNSSKLTRTEECFWSWMSYVV